MLTPYLLLLERKKATKSCRRSSIYRQMESKSPSLRSKSCEQSKKQRQYSIVSHENRQKIQRLEKRQWPTILQLGEQMQQYKGAFQNTGSMFRQIKHQNRKSTATNINQYNSTPNNKQTCNKLFLNFDTLDNRNHIYRRKNQPIAQRPDSNLRSSRSNWKKPTISSRMSEGNQKRYETNDEITQALRVGHKKKAKNKEKIDRTSMSSSEGKIIAAMNFQATKNSNCATVRIKARNENALDETQLQSSLMAKFIGKSKKQRLNKYRPEGNKKEANSMIGWQTYDEESMNDL